MSGKGSNSNSGKKSTASTGERLNQNQPTIVSGWEYHQYAQSSDRYVYIGKDEDTREPEFLDYGPKTGR
jgi:hypothetical protein